MRVCTLKTAATTTSTADSRSKRGPFRIVTYREGILCVSEGSQLKCLESSRCSKKERERERASFRRSMNEASDNNGWLSLLATVVVAAFYILAVRESAPRKEDSSATNLILLFLPLFQADTVAEFEGWTRTLTSEIRRLSGNSTKQQLQQQQQQQPPQEQQQQQQPSEEAAASILDLNSLQHSSE